MRMWRWQKVIGSDVCKIVILTGHDIQMTWQTSINMKVCVSRSRIVLSNNVGFSSWVGNISFFFFFFSSPNVVTCLKPFPLSGNGFHRLFLVAYLIISCRNQLSTLPWLSRPLQPSPSPSHNALLCVFLWRSVSTRTVIAATINRINQRWHWALWSRWRM